MALSRGMAGEPGGLWGEVTPPRPLGSNIVCWTVIVCRKSDGELIFCPGSFFKSLSLDRLNFPENNNVVTEYLNIQILFPLAGSEPKSSHLLDRSCTIVQNFQILANEKKVNK